MLAGPNDHNRNPLYSAADREGAFLGIEPDQAIAGLHDSIAPQRSESSPATLVFRLHLETAQAGISMKNRQENA
jgi:hypothetical protein